MRNVFLFFSAISILSAQMWLEFECPETVFSGSTNNLLSINIESSEDVFGIQFSILIDSDILTISDVSGGDALNEGELFTWNQTDSTLLWYCFDFDGTPCVNAGSGELVQLLFDVSDTEAGSADLQFEYVNAANFLGESLQVDFSTTCTFPIDLFADVNQDGLLNIQDVLVLIDCIIWEEDCPLADLDDDGVANVRDVILLINLILSAPEE